MYMWHVTLSLYMSLYVHVYICVGEDAGNASRHQARAGELERVAKLSPSLMQHSVSNPQLNILLPIFLSQVAIVCGCVVL